MKYPSYPDYKATRTSWLGTIPSHWTTQPLWSMFHREKTVGMPDEELLSVFRDYGVIPKSQRENLNKTAENRDIYQFVDSGWLVTNRMKAWQGSVGIAQQRGIVSGHYIVFRPLHGENDAYLNLLMRSDLYTLGYRTLSRGVRPGQAEIDNDQYRTLPVVVPPRAEQDSIVNWLQGETSQIDEMIGKQNALIELLAERRKAVITKAVTKGLDPNVSLRDSGLKWLGAIPDHWGIKRLSWMFRSIGSGTTPANEDLLTDGFEHWWVTTGELRETIITATLKGVTDETLKKTSALRIYPPGTLLTAMYGATIGRLGTLGVAACTNQACCAFSQPQNTLPQYVFYALQAAQEHVLLLASGGGQPNINQEKLRSLRLPSPGLEEQFKIVEYLDRETSALDGLVQRATALVALARERRSAIITAAVTGKIDVREAA